MADLPISRGVLRPSHADRIERALRSLGFEARVTGKPYSKDVEVITRDLERVAGIMPPGETNLPIDRYARGFVQVGSETDDEPAVPKEWPYG